MKDLCLAAVAAVLSSQALGQGSEAIANLSDGARVAMTGVSWQEGCPVGFDDLSVVSIAFVDFNGAERSGQIVVHRQLAPEVARFSMSCFRNVSRSKGSNRGRTTALAFTQRRTTPSVFIAKRRRTIPANGVRMHTATHRHKSAAEPVP